MPGVILVMIDGLGYEEMTAAAGMLEHLVEQNQAAKYRVQGALPSMSRPLYETVLTGLPAARHGIATNAYTRPSRHENLFSLTRQQGLENAAAAYAWVSELYNGNGPYDPLRHRYQLESEGDIRHGIFYHLDPFPDEILFQDGEYLRQKYHPAFLFLHPMGCDYYGHLFHKGSPEYRGAAAGCCDTVAYLMESWRNDGYDVVVTADHGMDELGSHAGNTPVQREVGLYIVSGKVAPGHHTDTPIRQTQVAPLCCALLGITRGAEMEKPEQIRGLSYE